MKTLLREQDRTTIASRVAKLRPDAARHWGRMTAPQMVCHLTDSFCGVLGERAIAPRTTLPPLLSRTLLKWGALYVPRNWPQGFKTRPEVDQEQGGTPPAEFATDIDSLNAACGRFVNGLDAIAQRPHFVFGYLTPSQWARWGYLHMDHHLRQFGV